MIAPSGWSLHRHAVSTFQEIARSLLMPGRCSTGGVQGSASGWSAAITSQKNTMTVRHGVTFVLPDARMVIPGSRQDPTRLLF